jgi:C_GCAxxG_C_C family probable redox protein
MTRLNSENHLVDRSVEALIKKIRQRSENLFTTKQLMCSEAVLTVLNQGLKGGLSPEITVRLTSGLPEGFGGSGCTCGALSAGIISLGLFLGRNGPGFFNNRTVYRASKELHDRFKACFGATCCRVLTKNIKVGTQSYYQLCAKKAGTVAEQAARLILEQKSELVDKADWTYVNQTDSNIGGRIRQLANTFRP